MSEQRLSLPEFSALVVLAVEAGEISNTELKERRGLTIDGRKRLRLNELKLVESWKRGRTFVHVLTDRGWARLAEDLRAGSMPAMTGSAGVVARALLDWLPAYLKRSDQRLADVFQPLDAPPTDDAPPADLEARVRAAYAELAPEPGSWVGLAKVRSLLSDVPRERVDEALTRMERLRDVNLVPESNQRTLTPQDQEAAVIIGGQDKHLLWIGEA
ncbi:hypothetical protein [Nonomuraea sp. LPB2021202275-12-8]|uniref:hypothetical protein n=1 Tax=Nonomuraea sp. LPB2021202275-12-8 TaxID=3120159 RepID=UPI00300D00B8